MCWFELDLILFKGGAEKEREGYKRHAILVVLLVPIRITRHVLRFLSVMLLLLPIEHLLKELELRICH
jgi:hypothetical protein